MVIQYRPKGTDRWKDYEGKSSLTSSTAKFQWRLLDSKKEKQLWPSKGKEYSTYEDVMHNFRRIEFFKHNQSYEPQFRHQSDEDVEWERIMIKQHKGELTPKEVIAQFIKEHPKKNRSSIVFKRYKTNKPGGQRYHVGRNQGMGVYVYRQRMGGKHLGDETDPENAQLRQATPIPSRYREFPQGQMQYAFEKIAEDDGDINEVRVTDPDDFIVYQWKKGEGTTFPQGKDKERMFPRNLDNQLPPDKLKQVKKLRDDK